MSKAPPPPSTRQRRDSFNVFFDGFFKMAKDAGFLERYDEATLKGFAKEKFAAKKKAAHIEAFLASAKKKNSGFSDLNDATLKQLAESNWEDKKRERNIAAFLKEAGVSEEGAKGIAANVAPNIAARRRGESVLPDLETANLFEADKIRASGQNIHTIEGLDAYIGALFPDKLGDEEYNPMRYKLSGKMDDLCPVLGEDVCGWQPLDTEGRGNDCLINSFLLTSSRNFRRLPTDFKNVVSRSFRKHVYGKFVKEDGHVDDAYVKRVVFGKQFLSDFDMNILFNKYGRDLIVFETAKDEEITHVVRGKQEKIDVHQPASVVYPGFSASEEVAVILNKGNAHYEAVVVRKEGKELKLTVSRAKAREIIELVRALRYKPEERLGCEFAEGDHVKYKGGDYYVITRKMDPPECTGYWLANKEQWTKFEALSRSQKDSTPVQEAHTTIKITKDNVKHVKAFASGGGGRTRRRRNKNRTRRSKRFSGY